MNLECTRVKSLGFLVSALVWACSSSDEAEPPDLGQAEVGGSGLHSGGAVSSSPRSGGTSSFVGSIVGGAGGVSSGGNSATRSGSGGSTTVGATSTTAGGKTSSGGTRSTLTSVAPNGGRMNSGGAASTTLGGSKSSGGTSSTRATGGNRSSGGSRATGGATASTKSSGGSSAAGGSSGSRVTGGASSGGTLAAGGTQAAGGSSASGGSGNTSGADGCSDTLAQGITLSEVAVFQTGKIPVMQAGAAVTPSTSYGADIVEGRSTLFRAYVTVDSGFTSRQLSARLVLNDGASAYFSKQTISASSTELSTTNAFQIPVPASDVVAGLNYSIKIVECAAGSGTAHNPQFPASGQASLVTRLTGPIKITVVPVTANNITPALDENFASSVKGEFEAMYPTNDVQITLSSTPITGCAITPSVAADGTIWSNCLDLVRSRRSADRAAAEVYYLGVVTPATSLRTFCGNSCVAGISYQVTGTGSSTRASLAVGFVPDGLDTMAHEVGHAHGLAHSPGCGASSADANFPYVTNSKSYIGWVGWDSRKPTTFLDPAKLTDIMAYCAPQWVSDYVYSKWEDRVATVNKNPAMMGAVEPGLWRVLNVIDNVAQWGQPSVYPEPPSGDPETATVLDADGHVIQETTVYRTAISIDSPDVVTAASYMIPEPQDTWDSILVADTVAKFDR